MSGVSLRKQCDSCALHITYDHNGFENLYTAHFMNSWRFRVRVGEGWG